MARLTKLNRQKNSDQNEGLAANTSYDSGNSSYDRQYTVKVGKLHIQESGKTSWADSRYNKEWVATDEETHRFLYDNQWRMNTDGID